MRIIHSYNAYRWPARLVLTCWLCVLPAARLPALDRPAVATAARVPFSLAASADRLELPSSIAVDYTARELELFDDLGDGRLDRHALLTAALVASGVVDADRLQRYQTVFEQFIERRQAEGCGALPPRLRAAALLQSLHQELLTRGYERPCTNLADVLDRGQFNCVSATILWQCLAEPFDLHSVAIELPGHMNAEIAVATGPLQVETTCAQWFQWQDDPALRQQAIDRVRRAEGSPHETRRTLDEAGLISAIYYNQGIDLLEAGRFAEAVAANAKAHRIDPGSAIARGNLLASINNWALWLAAEQEHARACQLLAAARRMAPRHAPFQVNYIAVHQQWIDHLVAEGQLAAADEIAARISRELPEQLFFSRVHRELKRQLKERQNSI